MSFSILTLPPIVTASQQVYNTFNANNDLNSVESRTINMCVLDDSKLEIRKVQTGMGMVRGRVDNTNEIGLDRNKPALISIGGSFLAENSINFRMADNTILQFIGNDNYEHVNVKINVCINAYCSVSDQQMKFQILRNGTDVYGACSTCVIGVNASSIAIECISDMVHNDYFAVSVTNFTDSNPITVSNISISGICIYM